MGLLTFKWLSGQHRKPEASPLLSLECVSVRLGQRLILDDVSLAIYAGEHVRITGPNGAGKSTMLDAIMGLVRPVAGRILYKGEAIESYPTHQRAQLGIRYMRQCYNVFPSLSVRNNLTLALGAQGYHHFQEAFPQWAQELLPTIPAGLLSGGQQQKLAWAMTVLGRGDLLLLDEPWSGVAPSTAVSPHYPSTVISIEHI